MDNIKIGKLIFQLRKEKDLTQLQLARLMNISDKTVSKWERGLGAPEASLLTELSGIFEVDVEKLLSGELCANKAASGNVKKTKFYVCPYCGNIVTAMEETNISCCGKKMKALLPQKADFEHALLVERIENDFYITTEHPMEKEHYISFVALLTSDTVLMKKLYPEWDVQIRLPRFAHGRLVWHCNNHGLFYADKY